MNLSKATHAEPSSIPLGHWAPLEAHVPGHPPLRIGILLRDTNQGLFKAKLIPEWWRSLGDDDGEIWQAFAGDFEQNASGLGCESFVELLNKTASHVFRLGPICGTRMTTIDETLEALYSQHVVSIEIQSRIANTGATESRGQRRIKVSQSEWPVGAHPRSIRTIAIWGAITLCFWAAAFVEYRPKAQPRIVTMRPTVVLDKAELLTSFNYPTTLPNLEQDWQPGRLRRSFIKAGKINRKKRFQTEKVSMRGVRPQLVLLSLSPAGISIESQISDPVSFPIAAAPVYRPRNRILHMLAVLAKPLKRLAVSNKD